MTAIADSSRMPWTALQTGIVLLGARWCVALHVRAACPAFVVVQCRSVVKGTSAERDYARHQTNATNLETRAFRPGIFPQAAFTRDLTLSAAHDIAAHSQRSRTRRGSFFPTTCGESPLLIVFRSGMGFDAGAPFRRTVWAGDLPRSAHRAHRTKCRDSLSR